MNNENYNFLREILIKYGLENPSDEDIEELNKTIENIISNYNSSPDDAKIDGGDATYMIK